MSVNNYRSHILVLPEDSANYQIANGFLLNFNLNERLIQVLPFAHGWETVLDKFTDNHVSKMKLYPQRMIVLLIDFDEKEDRLAYVEAKIPPDLKDRVFVLGVFSEPEKLKSDIKKSFEEIGEALATDCSDNTYKLWSHDLLKHNRNELQRMITTVKPFLFN
jgi:hypothetical protein